MMFLVLISIFFNQGIALETVALQGSSKLNNEDEAKTEIQSAMTEKLATGAIIKLIGISKFESNKELVKKIVDKKVDRFIPFINNGNLLKVEDEYKMVVTFKISYEDLREILRAEGLFKSNTGDLNILPMIKVTDVINGKDYSWWQSEKDDQDYSKIIVDLFKVQFTNSNDRIKIIIPENKKLSLLDKPSFSTSDYISLGKKFDADLVLVGRVTFKGSNKKLNQINVETKFSAISVTDGKIIGEISKKLITSSVKDRIISADVIKKVTSIEYTANEISKAWNTGEIGSRIVYLKVKGNYTYSKISELKNVLATTIRGVHSVTEHIFKKGEIVFKLETDSSARELARELRKLNLKSGKFRYVRSFGSDLNISFLK